MYLIEIIILFLFIAFNLQAKEELYFQFLDRSMDADVLLQFKDKNEKEIINILRHEPYGIKVLILDAVNPGFSINANLSDVNLAEDKEALGYYNENRDEQTCIKNEDRVRGEFLVPFVHFNHEETEAIQRPYLNKPLILLTKSAKRMDLLHEYLHYYAYQSEKIKAVVLRGIKHSYKCISSFNFKKGKFFLFNIKKNEEDSSLQYQMINYIIQNLKWREGEEVDVSLILAQQGRMLGFNKEDIKESILFAREKLNELKERLSLFEKANIPKTGIMISNLMDTIGSVEKIVIAVSVPPGGPPRFP